MFIACSNQSTDNNTSEKDNSENKTDNIIRVTMDSDIDNLDPFAFKGDAAYTVVNETYDKFIDYATTTDSDGVIVGDPHTPASNLADLSFSEDGKVVTLKIKPGITFTNGNPVDANAVAFSIKRALDQRYYSYLLWNVITLNSPDQVEVIDEYTVQLTLEKGNLMTEQILPLGLNVVMDPVITEENAKDGDEFASEFYKHNVMGTGPYVLDNWTPGVEYSLKPVENYWNPDKLKNDGVLVKVVPDAQQRLALLKQGAVDVAIGLPAKDLAQLKDDPNLEVYDFDSISSNFLIMNNNIAPFDNPLVRKAVNLALPYEDLIENVVYGFAQEMTSPVPKGMPSHIDIGKNLTNIEEAKKLMEQAGVSNVDTELYVDLSRTEDHDVAVYVKEALQEIGINVNIKKVSAAAYRQNSQEDTMPMFIEYFFPWLNDPYFLTFFLYHSKSTATNYSNYSNPKVDELIEAGMYEQDAEKREEISKEIQKLIYEDAPVAWLFQKNWVVAANKDVKGMNKLPDQLLRLYPLHK